MDTKIMSKKDTDSIAKHLNAIRKIITRYESDKNNEVAFNSNADLFCDSMLYAAGMVEHVWNNTNS